MKMIEIRDNILLNAAHISAVILNVIKDPITSQLIEYRIVIIVHGIDEQFEVIFNWSAEYEAKQYFAHIIRCIENS
jgi:hypothetical protein